MQWDDTKRYAEKHFPEAVNSGLLPNTGSIPSMTMKFDVSKTEKQLGIKARSFEEMVVDVVGQYVELAEKEKNT